MSVMVTYIEQEDVVHRAVLYETKGHLSIFSDNLDLQNDLLI